MKDKEEYSRDDPKTSHKAYWLGVFRWIIPVGIIFIGLFMTTQTFAHLMNYDPDVVGHPIMVLKSGYRVYNVLVFILGMIKYAFNDVYSYYFFQAIPPTFIAVSISLILFLLLSILTTMHQKKQDIYGTAEWGKVKHLERIGMLQERGVVCGQLSNANVTYKIGGEENDKLILMQNNTFLRTVLKKEPKTVPLVCHSGATNTLVLMPTRAGKGVTIIIPTLLSYGVPYWGYIYDKASKFYKMFKGKLKFLCRKKVVKGKKSVVVFDPKAENYEATAGFRSKFSTVLPFNPMKIKDSKGNEIGTIHYNPLHEIPDNDEAFAWADMFGSFFFSEGGQGENAFFYNSARDIFVAVVLHVRFSKKIPWKEKTFTKVLDVFSVASEDGTAGDGQEDEGCGVEMIKEMKEEGVHVHDDGSEFKIIHDLIVKAGNRSLTQTPKERGTIYSTVFSQINFFQDPNIADVISYSDFSARDFLNCKNGISLYLIIPYSDLQRISPLFRMIVDFIIRVFSRGATNANSQKLGVPCLFVLDEFPALGGKFESIERDAGVLAGFGCTFLIICQSLGQLEKLYGEHHAFLDHCKTVVIGTPGNYKDAKSFSESIGNRSVLLDNISSSGNKFEVGWNNVSRGSQEISTSLINADELMKLEFNRLIILNQGMPPYKGKKVVYYEDPRFKHLAFLPYPSIETNILKAKKLPSHKQVRSSVSYNSRNNELINSMKAEAEKAVKVMTALNVLPSTYDLF